MAVPVERRTKRWQEQRWILDNIIRTVGIERNQPRIASVGGGVLHRLAARASAQRSIFESSLQNLDDNAPKVHGYQKDAAHVTSARGRRGSRDRDDRVRGPDAPDPAEGHEVPAESGLRRPGR